MSAKPITPEEAHREFCEKYIPDFVIETVNSLLAAESSSPGRKVTLLQDRIIEKMMKNPAFPDDANRQTIFDKSWLDFETIYKQAGWNVAYEAPAIDEDFASCFTFTPIKKYERY